MAQEPQFPEKPVLPPVIRWFIGLVTIASISVAAIGVYTFSQAANSDKKTANSDKTTATTTTPTPTSVAASFVTALGRLEPKGEVIKLSASSSSMSFGTPRLAELRVREGDKVQENQIIAILDSRDQLQAALQEADKQVRIKQAELAKVKAGAKQGEITAQEAEIARWQAQLKRETEAQAAEIARLKAQLRRETEAQRAKVAMLEAQKQGEIATQQAQQDRLVAELENAVAEYKRNQGLYEDGAISASIYDSKRLTMEAAKERVNEVKAALNKTKTTVQQEINEAQATLQRTIETIREQINQAQATLKQMSETGREQINQAQATLEKIAEVRPEDVEAAQAEVERAMATKEKAQTDLSLAFVRSPITGTVLKVNTRPGEKVADDKGIIELGHTDQMYVVAEVYETDIQRVRLGQSATVTSDAVKGELAGTVDQIGWQISKKDVLDTDPAADVDARVIEVKIRLNAESSQKVAALTNLQVKVKILIEQ